MEGGFHAAVGAACIVGIMVNKADSVLKNRREKKTNSTITNGMRGTHCEQSSSMYPPHSSSSAVANKATEQPSSIASEQATKNASAEAKPTSKKCNKI